MSVNEPKKRLKAAESRRALLDAGRDLLRANGVAPGLDRVTLKDAIELSGVPRSTAYRLYEGGDGQLEAFRSDLLVDLDSSVDMEPVIAALETVRHDRADALASNDPLQLAAVLREFIRVGVQATVELVADNVEWQVYMSSLAAWGTAPRDPDAAAAPDLTEAFLAAATAAGDRWVPLFQQFMSTVGLRPRPPLTMQDFGALATATLDGVALRQHLDPRLGALKRPTGPEGSLESWNGAAVALEAIVLVWCEADPAAVASADLSAWTAF